MRSIKRRGLQPTWFLQTPDRFRVSSLLIPFYKEKAMTVPSSLPLRQGTRINQGNKVLVLNEQIATGGVSKIWTARLEGTQQQFVIKFPWIDDLSHWDLVRQHFEREMKIARALPGHPNLINCVATGSLQDHPYIVLEYAPGVNVHDILESKGALPWSRAVRIVCDACLALAHLHEQGVLHLDLKPDNLLLGDDGVVRLHDLGAAKRISASEDWREERWFGTPGFTCPEGALETSQIDVRSDVYSMAVVLFSLLTCSLPIHLWTDEYADLYCEFRGVDRFELPTMESTGRYRLPRERWITKIYEQELPVALDTIITDALAIDPNKRFTDIRQFAKALSRIDLPEEE